MTTDETLAAILAEVKGLRADVAKIQATADRNLKGTGLLVTHLGAAPRAAGGSPGGAARIASDAEIDDPEWGDKEIRKDPPKWKGESHKGDRWSACSADYLEALAAFLDWAAGKKRSDAESQTGEEKSKSIKYAGFDEADAAKVRAWAKRKRATQPAPDEAPQSLDDIKL